MQIAAQKVVSFDYTLTSARGEVLDTSQGKAPLAYLHGVGNIIPGLESELAGKKAGDELTVTVPADKAYGLKDPRMVQAVPRTAFPSGQPINVGMQFEARSPQGARMVTVVAVDDLNVTVDANHPLAGMPLTFAVKIIDVRDATPEELTHGHVHGPGGHQHG